MNILHKLFGKKSSNIPSVTNEPVMPYKTREKLVLTSKADFKSVEKPKKKRRPTTLKRGQGLYQPNQIDLDDPRSFSPRRIARNGVHEEEMVFIMNGQLHRTMFLLDAWASYRCYSLETPFFIVIHRHTITYEEQFFIEVVLSKCPYFQGLILKTGEFKYEKVHMRGLSA